MLMLGGFLEYIRHTRMERLLLRTFALFFSPFFLRTGKSNDWGIYMHVIMLLSHRYKYPDPNSSMPGEF